jgi:uncharacterized membrane protein
MSQPQNRTEFLIRFIIAAIFFGVVVALIGLRFVTTLDLLTVVVWILVSLSLSILVAVRGDGAWRGLANLFKWS